MNNQDRLALLWYSFYNPFSTTKCERRSSSRQTASGWASSAKAAMGSKRNHRRRRLERKAKGTEQRKNANEINSDSLVGATAKRGGRCRRCCSFLGSSWCHDFIFVMVEKSAEQRSVTLHCQLPAYPRSFLRHSGTSVSL